MDPISTGILTQIGKQATLSATSAFASHMAEQAAKYATTNLRYQTPHNVKYHLGKRKVQKTDQIYSGKTMSSTSRSNYNKQNNNSKSKHNFAPWMRYRKTIRKRYPKRRYTKKIYRKKRYRRKTYRKKYSFKRRTGLSNKLKSARFNINTLYPNQTSTTLKLKADSQFYTDSQILILSGNQRAHNTIMLNSSKPYLNQGIANEISDYHPVDYTAGIKIQNYGKARVNFTTITLRFTINDTFNGYIYLMPCVKGETGTGNYTTQDSTLATNPFYTPNTQIGNITSDSILQQRVIKYKRVKVVSPVRPAIFTLSAKYRTRDLLSMTKHDYVSEQNTYCNIDESPAHGYILTPPTQPQFRAYCQYGILSNSSISPALIIQVDQTITQKIQLLDAKRIDPGSSHIVV